MDYYSPGENNFEFVFMGNNLTVLTSYFVQVNSTLKIIFKVLGVFPN